MSWGHCSRHWPYICESRHRSLEKSALAAFVDFGLQGVSKMAIQLDLAAEGFSSQVNRGWLVEFDFRRLRVVLDFFRCYKASAQGGGCSNGHAWSCSLNCGTNSHFVCLFFVFVFSRLTRARGGKMCLSPSNRICKICWTSCWDRELRRLLAVTSRPLASSMDGARRKRSLWWFLSLFPL